MSNLKCPHCGKDVYPDNTSKYASKYEANRKELLALRERNRAIAETYATGAVSVKETGIIHNLSANQVGLALSQDQRERERIEKYEKAFHECSSYMEMPIEVLDLTVRTKNGLLNQMFDEKYGFLAYHRYRDQWVATVGDAFKVTDHELMRIPNFGRASLYEWKQCQIMLIADFEDRKPAGQILYQGTGLHTPVS